jgi:hypothetical protein
MSPIIGIAGLLELLAAVERLRQPRSHGNREEPDHGRPAQAHSSPPPSSERGGDLWDQLPPARRQQLLNLLSRLLERQLPRPGGEEDDDEPARCPD